jgi:hypothetical protein
MECHECFDQDLAESAFIDVAQPRWIGPRYFDASMKMMIISLNPGTGNTTEKQQSNSSFRQILYDYKDGTKARQCLFAFEKEHIPRWGTPLGRFAKFYIDGIGLILDNIALANIAWCAAKGNKCGGRMLSKCFDLHTSKLIAAICPDIAILSGSGTHKYASEIERLVPRCKVVCMMHYAHRKGKDAEGAELLRVRKEIALARKR